MDLQTVVVVVVVVEVVVAGTFHSKVDSYAIAAVVIEMHYCCRNLNQFQVWFPFQAHP